MNINIFIYIYIYKLSLIYKEKKNIGDSKAKCSVQTHYSIYFARVKSNRKGRSNHRWLATKVM